MSSSVSRRPSRPSWPWLPILTAVVWLLGVAGLLHLHERPEDKPWFLLALAVTLSAWPVLMLDAALGVWNGWWSRRAACLSALIPVFRIGLAYTIAARPSRSANVEEAPTLAADQPRELWLPVWGWQPITPILERHVARALNGPMLVVSLCVLPLVAIELYWTERLAADPVLHQCVAAATAVVWWAFTLEFVLMLSLTEKKQKYCVQHWLDIVVILLPLLAFLRVLQLGRLLRVQQVTRMVRVYRLRGVMMKTYRTLLLVDAVKRLLEGGPERRLMRLRERLRELDAELASVRTEIALLEETQRTPMVKDAAVLSSTAREASEPLGEVQGVA